eukprot:7150812-Prymnesium_polylepis.1
MYWLIAPPGERLLLTLGKLAVACTCTALSALAMSFQRADAGALDNANGARPNPLARDSHPVRS